jgi:hypothetical protein
MLKNSVWNIEKICYSVSVYKNQHKDNTGNRGIQKH